MLGILVANEGGTQAEVSLIAAAYSLGFGLGCFAAPQLVRRNGVIRTYAAAAAIATITIIGLEASDDTLAWAALRFFMGASIAAVLAVSDTWINHETPEGGRGQVIAIYSIVLGAASIASQFVFLWMGADAERLILLFAVLMNLAVAVIATTRSEQPVLPETKTAAKVFTMPSTTAGTGAFVSGFSVAGIVSIIPFYMTSHGVSVTLVATFVMLLYLGRLAAQWPIGLLSDRFDRRAVIAALTLPTLLIALTEVFLGEGEGRALSGELGRLIQAIGILVPVLLGGAIYPLYSVASSLAFDRAEEGTMTEVSATQLLLYSAGSVLGPGVVMLTSSVFGDNALSVCLFAANGALLLTAVFRLRRTEPPTESTPAMPVPEGSLTMAQAVGEIAEDAAAQDDLAGANGR